MSKFHKLCTASALGVNFAPHIRRQLQDNISVGEIMQDVLTDFYICKASWQSGGFRADQKVFQDWVVATDYNGMY